MYLINNFKFVGSYKEVNNIKEWNNPEVWQLGVENTETPPCNTSPGNSDNTSPGQGGGIPRWGPGGNSNQHS